MRPGHRPISPRFYWQWVGACSLGEMLGIGFAAVLAVAYNHQVTLVQTTEQAVVLIGVYTLSGLVEGTVSGSFQWWVLRRRYPQLTYRWWVGCTAAVAVLGWWLGAILPLALELGADATEPQPDPVLWMQLVFGAGMGLVTGALFGAFQHFALRRAAQRSRCWVAANALAWMVAMVFVFAGASIPDTSWEPWSIYVMGIVGGLLGGASLGLITGHFLGAIPPNATTKRP